MSIKDLLEGIRDANNLVDAAEEERDRLEIALMSDLALRHGVTEVALGSWECKDSPTDMCYYDTQEDPCHDFCLVCGGPEERK